MASNNRWSLKTVDFDKELLNLQIQILVLFFSNKSSKITNYNCAFSTIKKIDVAIKKFIKKSRKVY